MTTNTTQPRSTLSRAWDILQPETRDIGAIVFYGILVSLLSLTVPVAVQALVNSVAYGQLTQQLLVLSFLVFLVLTFSGFFSAVQYYYVELLQRRLFTRYALDLAIRIPRFASSGLRERLGAEFVNPFLEVVVLHKSLSHLFLGGLGLVLQIVVGVILLGVYHPLLLLFSLVLIGVIFCIFAFGGRGGVKSADEECSAKYSVLNWLEDMARMSFMFHSTYGESFGLHQADLAVKKWLDSRRRHFQVLFRQNVTMFLVHALASSALLGLGGVLVIHGQLSLGQLVAAELVLNAALSGLSKFGKHLESFYDMMAALGKLEHLRSLTLESEGDEAIPDEQRTAAKLEIRGLSIISPESQQPILSGIDFEVQAGQAKCIYALGSCGKTLLLDCIYGLVSEYKGQIRLDGFDLDDLTRRSLRTRIGVVAEPEFFHGTLEENLKVGVPGITRKQIREKLDLAGLDEAIARLPQGLETRVSPRSGLLSRGELVRFSMVRTVLAKPGLILTDQSFDTLDPRGLEAATRLLLDQNRTWSVLVATNQRHVARLFPSCVQLRFGKLEPFNPFSEKDSDRFTNGGAIVSD